jgi:ABC-2 type transport system permease protein
MVNWNSKKLGDFLLLANIIVAVVFLNLLASQYFFRWDLTEERRYSLKEQTIQTLQSLEEDVHIELYLAGDLNAAFTRFQKSIVETLEEFRIYSNNRIRYTITDPSAALSQKAQQEFMSDLASRGIQPTNVIEKKNGQHVEKLIFPGVVISVGQQEKGVMLLKGSKAKTSEEQINQSIEGVEFTLIQTLYVMVNTERKHLGYVSGHGELDSLQVASFVRELRQQYDVSRVYLSEETTPQRYDALIIAKPTKEFSSLDKFYLDQYVMQGGKVLMMLDRLDASMDSVMRDHYFAMPLQTNLDDLLFTYGVRINGDLIQDRQSGMYPIITGNSGGKPQMQLMEWLYNPLINQYANHPITRNLDAVLTRFVSTVDTVKAVGVSKTPLLYTSPYTRVVNAPVLISANDVRRVLKDEQFTKGVLPVGYLLSGTFSSLYKNRFPPEGASTPIIPQSIPTKIIVIADGDVVRNDVDIRSGNPHPLGFDTYTQYTFANGEFVLNALAYLLDAEGIILTRNKEVKIRPLDKTKMKNDKLFWQSINIGLPVLGIVLFGLIRWSWRKRKYAQF